MSDEIKSKIVKLLNLARDKGATEAEAATAMSMATRLMIANGIKEDELRTSAAIAGRSELTELDTDWQKIVANAAGMLMGCMTIFTKNNLGQPAFYFIGRPENHKSAADLFNFLADQVERLYKTSLPKGMTQKLRANYRRTFKYACASRIGHRAGELIAEMKRGDLQVSGSTALVVQNHFDKLADEVDEFLKKSGSNIRMVTPKHRAAGDGTAAGLVAGNSVNLRGAIT